MDRDTAGAAVPGRVWIRAVRRDQRFLAAIAAALLSFSLAQLIDQLDVGPGGAAAPDGLRLLSLILALLGAATALDRSHRRQLASVLGWQRLAADLRDEADAAAAVQEERAHEARSALAAIELAIATVDREVVPGGMPVRQAVQAEVALLRRLLDAPDAAEPDAFAVAIAVAEPVAIERLRGTPIDWEPDPGLLAWGDPRATAEIIRNLLENARRHGQGAPIRITTSAPPDRVRITIADRGPGVPAQIRDRVFSRGVTTAGSGLGLTIAAELAAQQGGSLALEPATTGAAFTLELPAAPGSPS